jgi:nucleotide-binding universal stress UspA family protein
MFHQLLLAIDDSPAGPVSISFATALAREYSASVHVVHVNQYQLGGRGLTLLTDAEATRLVDSAVEELRAAGVPASGSVVRGTCFDVAARIVESAQAWSAHTIILGSRGHHRFWPNWRGHGVRQQVMRGSTIPVVSAPAPLKVSGRAHLDVDALTRELDGGSTLSR